MKSNRDGPKKIYILGCGAVGLTLAAYLADAGRSVVAVRTGRDDVPAGKMDVTVRSGGGVALTVPVETISLSGLAEFDGIVVVTAKSHANEAIASALASKVVAGPLVIMQNGIGVENSFLESGFASICRCVLYMTAQTVAGNDVTFRAIASSPIGVVKGLESDLEECVEALTTPGFPFHPESNMPRDIWKKTIMNAVFNSICPLLDVDNGIFVRDEPVAELAQEIVRECVVLAGREGVSFTEAELMEQVFKISRGSDGVLISTLQDIRNGRETEIESLNLEMARTAAALKPPVDLVKTGFLGKMVRAKSTLGRCART